MLAAPGWADALARAASARTTVILGASDSGKSTLAAFLAEGLRGRGFGVLVLDADLGQSQIGPPTTLGLGRVRGPVGRLADVAPDVLWFVGATSPIAHVDAVAEGVRRLGARVAPGERLIVDTSGLVAGPAGLALKRQKLAALRPDLAIALERADECGALLAGGEAAEVLRVPVAAAARPRSAAARARFRDEAFAAYFAGAPVLWLPLTGDRGRSALAAIAPVDGRVLVGVEDEERRLLGLGQIADVAADGGSAAVITPAAAARAARLKTTAGSIPLATLHEVRP